MEDVVLLVGPQTERGDTSGQGADAVATEPVDAELEDLDDLDDVDFDLDEVENKIAPLALADMECGEW